MSTGDYDGDALLDLFKINLVREGSTLYRNLGEGVFADTTQAARLLAATRPFTAFGCGFLDVENDGWLDVFQVSGAIQRIPALVERGDPFPLHQPNQLLRNRGDGTFEDVSAASGEIFALSEVSRGAAFGDVDNDVPLHAVRRGDWKLIDAPSPELYDTRSDPGEESAVDRARTRHRRAGSGP